MCLPYLSLLETHTMNSPTLVTGYPRPTKLFFAWLIITGLVFIAAAPHPGYAAGANLKVSPPSGSYEVGGLVDVAFILDTGGEAVNAVQADIIFPADKLQVVNPVASTSFISIWVSPPSYSNTSGTIHFQGGLPNPGIKTSAGVISTVTFRVKSSGKAAITYAPTSKVLRNDGEGTNILASTSSADYTLKLPPPAGPIVTSPTHPDTDRWYSNRDIQVQWVAADGAVGYSYSFDQNLQQEPDDTVDTTTTNAHLKATGDGTWYFHLHAKTNVWGGSTTYPVQIDSTPPAAFKAELDKKLITTEEKGTLRWLTSDAVSGIDHYEVKQVNLSDVATGTNTLFIEATSPYIIPPLDAGQHEFIVRAIDRAGNSTEGTVELKVVKSGLSFLSRVPLLGNPAVANAAVITLASLVLLGAGLLILRRFRVRATFERDLAALEKDARKKSDVIQKELDQLRRAESIMEQRLIAATPPSPTQGPHPWSPPAAS